MRSGSLAERRIETHELLNMCMWTWLFLYPKTNNLNLPNV